MQARSLDSSMHTTEHRQDSWTPDRAVVGDTSILQALRSLYSQSSQWSHHHPTSHVVLSEKHLCYRQMRSVAHLLPWGHSAVERRLSPRARRWRRRLLPTTVCPTTAHLACEQFSCVSCSDDTFVAVGPLGRGEAPVDPPVDAVDDTSVTLVGMSHHCPSRM